MDVYISEKQLVKKKLVEKSLPIRQIKIEIAANQASTIPPLGPLLGLYGINTIEFCKEFNDESSIFEKETLVPITIYLGQNKQYYFEFKRVSVSYLIRKYLESFEFDSLFISKLDFLKICYNIAVYRALIFHKGNVEINKEYLKNLIFCIIGTFRSFNYKII
jgi:hypothetical protein